jgi:hypothetical protein
MQTPVNPPEKTQKQHLRDEITEQIREYLQRGGEIEVLNDNRTVSAPVGASVWSDLDDGISIDS